MEMISEFVQSIQDKYKAKYAQDHKTPHSETEYQATNTNNGQIEQIDRGKMLYKLFEIKKYIINYIKWYS